MAINTDAFNSPCILYGHLASGSRKKGTIADTAQRHVQARRDVNWLRLDTTTWLDKTSDRTKTLICVQCDKRGLRLLSVCNLLGNATTSNLLLFSKHRAMKPILKYHPARSGFLTLGAGIAECLLHNLSQPDSRLIPT